MGGFFRAKYSLQKFQGKIFFIPLEDNIDSKDDQDDDWDDDYWDNKMMMIYKIS